MAKISPENLEELQDQARAAVGDLFGLDNAIAAAVERIPEDFECIPISVDVDEMGNARVRLPNELSTEELECRVERFRRLLIERQSRPKVQ